MLGIHLGRFDSLHLTSFVALHTIFLLFTFLFNVFPLLPLRFTSLFSSFSSNFYEHSGFINRLSCKVLMMHAASRLVYHPRTYHHINRHSLHEYRNCHNHYHHHQICLFHVRSAHPLETPIPQQQVFLY